MSRALFAERFALEPSDPAAGAHVATRYDAARQYTVTSDGTAFVEATIVASTFTATFVTREAPDSDRDWDRALASVDTVTKVKRDRDHWDGTGDDVALR